MPLCNATSVSTRTLNNNNELRVYGAFVRATHSARKLSGGERGGCVRVPRG